MLAHNGAARIPANAACRGEVTSVRGDVRISRLASEIRNEAREACLTGTATTCTVPLK